MSDTKLAFEFNPPERGILLPLEISREKWFEIADQNNALRASAMRRNWYRYEMEDLYNELYAQ